MNRRKRTLQKRRRKQKDVDQGSKPKVLVFGEGTAAVKGEWTPPHRNADTGILTMFGSDPVQDAPRPAPIADQP